MNITHLTAVLSLLALVATAQAEKVYVCPLKNGQSEYTAVYRDGCRDAGLKKIEGYQPAVGSGGGAYHGDSPAAPPPPQAETSNAARQLAEAERALEEGKAVRHGNERNYAKYQERIRELEENVERARAKLQQSPNYPPR